jgi:hypothetical protein
VKVALIVSILGACVVLTAGWAILEADGSGALFAMVVLPALFSFALWALETRAHYHRLVDREALLGEIRRLEAQLQSRA